MHVLLDGTFTGPCGCLFQIIRTRILPWINATFQMLTVQYKCMLGIGPDPSSLAPRDYVDNANVTSLVIAGFCSLWRVWLARRGANWPHTLIGAECMSCIESGSWLIRVWRTIAVFTHCGDCALIVVCPTVHTQSKLIDCLLARPKLPMKNGVTRLLCSWTATVYCGWVCRVAIFWYDML